MTSAKKRGKTLSGKAVALSRIVSLMYHQWQYRAPLFKMEGEKDEIKIEERKIYVKEEYFFLLSLPAKHLSWEMEVTLERKIVNFRPPIFLKTPPTQKHFYAFDPFSKMFHEPSSIVPLTIVNFFL